MQKRRLKLPDSKVLQSYGKECKQIKFLDHIDELENIDNALFMMETSGAKINKIEFKLNYSKLCKLCKLPKLSKSHIFFQGKKTH